jgi:hypothetical protein
LTLHSIPQFLEARTQLLAAHSARRRAGAHDQIEARQLVLAQPKALPDQPSQAIALDRASGCLRRDGKSEPRGSSLVRARGDREEPIAEAPPARVNGIEVGFPA